MGFDGTDADLAMSWLYNQIVLGEVSVVVARSHTICYCTIYTILYYIILYYTIYYLLYIRTDYCLCEFG